ncbi:MAG: response regulator [Vulcanimicrobiaceae bacterium]|jgi:DNA-binding response OmpR family regulator
MLEIMIVDEHWADIPTYKRLLTEFPGSHVTCFPDHNGAYRECSFRTPDILLIDDDVSKSAPIAFARRFRKIAGSNEPVIMLMSAQREGLAELARCSGVDAFMPKPLDAELFMTMIHHAVKLRAARHRLAATPNSQVLRT